MSDTPDTSIHASFQDWRARLDAATTAGTVEQTEMLALMFDLRQTLEDVAYRLHAMHQAEYLGILDEYSNKHDLVLELPPRKPTT
jgi:hypothetical protein